MKEETIIVNGEEVEDSNYRKIAELYFQKKVQEDEIVHHIDGNHYNNDPQNLVIMKKEQHNKTHPLGKEHGQSTKNKARKMRHRHPNWSAEKIGKKLNRCEETIWFHTSDIIKKQRRKQHQLIINLWEKGKNITEISNNRNVNLSYGRISQIIKEYKEENQTKLSGVL